MTTFIRIKHVQFYLALGAIWLLLWGVHSFLSYPATSLLHFRNDAWRTIYIVIANFIFFEYALPFIIKKRSNILLNILIGVSLVTLHLILLSFGLYVWRNIGMVLHIYTQLRFSTLTGGLSYQLIDTASYEAESGFLSIFFFGIAKLFHYNFKLKQTAQQLRIEKQEAELNYLKSQTNPHFLFNTLNNIYGLAREKSDLAPESILRLSKILRFMLYEAGGTFITVEQELEIINDYISLEKLRYDESLQVNFKHEIDDMKQSLSPLLLVTLIENAFKHGASEASGQAFVDVHLSVKSRQLMFVVKNSTENLHGQKHVKENIGLSNLRRQLELIYADFNLFVRQDETVFTATLKINLQSHV